MFGTRWRLFRVFGIPISLDISWLIILFLLTLSFAGNFPVLLHRLFPRTPNQMPTYDYWIMGLVTALLFFACILLHELGHAVVARSRGMPIRGITLFLFGGVAELGDEPPSAGTEFLMAIAGPIVSVFLGVLFFFLAVVGYHHAWPHPVVIVLGYLGIINGLVLVFNMIPAFPLDGGRVFRSILWGITGNVRRSTYWASLIGQVFAWLLIGFGIFRLFMGDWGGIWMGLIGWFLYSAARSSYQQVLVRDLLQGESVRHFMNADPVVVAPSLDLLHWVQDYVYRHHQREFPVAVEGRLEGVVNTDALSRFQQRSWNEHTVGEIMSTDLGPITISADTDAMEALSKMQGTRSNWLLVTEGDRLLGTISLKDLTHFIQLKAELGQGSPSAANGGPLSPRDSMHRSRF